MSNVPAGLQYWVAEQAALLQAEEIVWVDGSAAEAHRFTEQLVAEGKLIKLNPHWRPGSYLARTGEDDVARIEERTFICTERREQAGYEGNWRQSEEMLAELAGRFRGSMRGRTLYVIPYCMGPLGSPYSRFGVQLTDSLYAVLSMRIMCRIGAEVLAELAKGADFVKGVHSVGYPLRDERGAQRPDVAWPSNPVKYVCHFPNRREIYSYGSGYGGNALLGKKCFGLRIASAMGRQEGWLAEHMLLIRITSPEGIIRHIAGAFPSACGKTNLAMLRSTLPGWRVETLGDDLVWMHVDDAGRLRAINPETGFFGVAPGTSTASNPNAMDTVWGNTIFTNVALRPDGDVWWEGMTERAPEGLEDWQGRAWQPVSGDPAAHPNSRFTAPILQCPSLAAGWDSPEGVVVDAIVFGGRRSDTVPLVTQARSWQHGVLMGALMRSEHTAAAEGVLGTLRRDPFAMAPFLGYGMAEHWAHWLELGKRLGDRAPAMFQVNWFRKDGQGRYLWPGFGENIRVLQWIVQQLDGGIGNSVESAVGILPEGLELSGLRGYDAQRLQQALAVDAEEWQRELADAGSFLEDFGERLPEALRSEFEKLQAAVQPAASLARASY